MTTENNQNELSVQEENQVSLIAKSNDEFEVIKDENGKYVRKAKYQAYSSVKAETREEKIWLMNLLEGDEESGNGLKSHIGKQIEVQDVIFRPYDKVNEDTGHLEYGVLTYLITPDRVAYATSSKSVYFTMKQLMTLFGTPDSEEWENIKIQVKSKRGANGDQILIKMVG